MPNYLSPGVYVRETDFSFYVKQISTAAAAMVGVAERGPVGKAQLVTSWEQFLGKYGGYIADGYLAYAARAFFDNGGQILYVNRVAHISDPTDRATLAAVKSSATIEGRGVAAMLTTGTAGTDEIRWAAREGGTGGNALSIVLVAAGTDSALTISVTGSAITINLATDASGNPASLVADVLTAIASHAQASPLITGASADTGIVQPAPQANLTGGTVPVDTLRIDAIDEGAWGDGISIRVENGSLDPAGAFNLVIRYKGNPVEVFKDLSMDEARPNHVELLVNEKSRYITVHDLSATSGPASDRPAVGHYLLAGGDNGLDTLTDADYIGDPSQHTGIYAFDEVEAVNMLMVPGVTSAPVFAAAIAYCEQRQDLMLIADTPVLLEPLEAVDFRKGQGMYSHAAFNSSYAALYYPWLEISDPMTSQKKLIPPCGAVAGCFARSDRKTAVWHAPAGIDRGRVFGALSVGYKTSRAERDVLYPEGVNVIAVFPDTGVNIWGQRTLQAQPSALDRINVRRLMIFMEEAIAKSSRFVVFEPNNPQTWRALVRLISPFLQGIKEKGGLYDYAVQCDEDTNTPVVIDRNELVCRVFVKPTKTAEFAELNFVLTATGANFTEIFGA